jgi:hypothetical protein
MVPTLDTFDRLFNLHFVNPLTGRKAAFAGARPPFADMSVLSMVGQPTVDLGSRGGCLEAVMAWKREENGTQDRKIIGMIWFAGVALFVVEMGAGLDYVQARVASWAPTFLGFLPAAGLTAWKILESAFWNYAQLVRTFQIVPFITLPFLLVGLALWMRYKMVFQNQISGNDNKR